MINANQKLAEPVGKSDHVRGPDTAAVTLVEYGDYQCPYCVRIAPIVEQLRLRFPDDLRFCYRNFPLTQAHPYAYGAAEAAEAAGGQGKFWEMHDLLYQNSPALSERDLLDYARQVGLNLDSFTGAMSKNEYRSKIESDVQSGLESGVQGTPSFFVNGAPYQGTPDLEGMSEAIERAAGSS
jgi:protein-disulfide isomerase